MPNPTNNHIPVSVRRREISDRLAELAGTLRAENREMTQEEREESNALRRELDWLNLEAVASTNATREGATREGATRPRYAALREAIGTGRVALSLREGAATTTAATTTAATTTAAHTTDNTMVRADGQAGSLEPLHVGDILYPVEEGLIWHLVGIRIPTGLAGSYVWPVVDDSSEAQFAGELEQAPVQKINISEVAAVQNRLYSGAMESRQAVINSESRVEEVIRYILPLRAVRAINHVLFSTVKLEKSNIQGPLVGLTAKTLSALGAKTFKELNTGKAELLGKGYSSARMCWVMSEATKAMLEATPKDAGSGIMVVENDRLCGLPIFCTHYIGENTIAIGDWGYQVVGQFGDVSFVVDNVTGADQDAIKFHLNTNYGTATLRQDAFALFKFTA